MFLDPLLIMVFHWGIGGAALATMFAKVPCGIIAVLSLFNKNNEIHIVLKNFKFDADKIEAFDPNTLKTESDVKEALLKGQITKEQSDKLISELRPKDLFSNGSTEEQSAK